MNTPEICPACKKGKLRAFDTSPTLVVFTCSYCDKTTTAKTMGGKIIEVVVPGVTTVTGAIAILSFFGIDNIDDLINRLSDHT